MGRFSAAAVALALSSGPAFATQPADAERPGRFALHPVDGGFVRLDTETGAVSLCTRGPKGFACEAVPDERGQQQEIERLTQANRALEAEVRRLAQEGTREAPARRGFDLPSEEDVDRALNYLERMVKKFRDRIRGLEGGSGRGTPL